MNEVLYNYFKMTIGVLIVMGFLITLGALFMVEIPTGNKMAVDIVLGTLGTLTVGICNYLYGTSRSSTKKNETIEKLMSNR